MKRIFLVLALLTSAALLTTYGVGLASKLQGAAAAGDGLYMAHFFLGLLTIVLGPLAVHCLIFIYFLGTGRWVKEVALAYRMPDQPWPKLTRDLKRQTFPVALGAMLISIATAAAGVGAQLLDWPWLLHFALATLTLFANLAAFAVEYRNVSLNAEAIAAVKAEADRMRREAGLPPSEVALREQEAR